MKHKSLEVLKELIANKYGDLDNDNGAYVNGQWLSIFQIVCLIEQVDENSN